MKKNIISFICLALAAYTLSANPMAINGANLPTDDKKFVQYSNQFLEYYDEINYWHTDIKPEAVSATENLYSYLSQIKKPSYDTQLLKFLTMRCLYNADKVSAEEMEAAVTELNKKYPERAEHHWIYGNYWTTTTRSVNALDEYNEYLELSKGMVSVAFLQNYAYGEMLAGKRLTALHAVKAAARFGGYDIEEDSIYKTLKANILDYEAGTEIPKEKLWKLVPAKEDGMFYFDSTLLGVSLKVDGKWNLDYTGLKDKTPVTVMIRPDRFKYADKEIGISAVLIAFPKSMTPEYWMEFTLYAVAQNVVNEEKKMIGNNEFTVTTYEDLNKYNDFRRGSRGYVYTATITPKEDSGARCEHAIDLSKALNKDSAQQIRYYKLEPTYNRIQDPVNIILLVDSCNAIAEETQSWIDSFLENVVFE